MYADYVSPSKFLIDDQIRYSKYHSITWLQKQQRLMCLGMMGDQLRAPLNPPTHHSTIVLRGLRGPRMVPHDAECQWQTSERGQHTRAMSHRASLSPLAPDPLTPRRLLLFIYLHCNITANHKDNYNNTSLYKTCSLLGINKRSIKSEYLILISLNERNFDNFELVNFVPKTIFRNIITRI